MSRLIFIFLPIVALLLNVLIHRNDGYRFIGMLGCLILASSMIIHSHWFTLRNLIPMLKIGYKPIDFGFRRIISKELGLTLSVYPCGKTKILFVLNSSKEGFLLRNFDFEIENDLVSKVIEFEKSKELDSVSGIPLINRMNEMNGVLRDRIVKGED